MNDKEQIIGRYIQVDNYRIHYDSIGEGQPLILLPTAGGSAGEYRNILEFFSGKPYHVIALEPPGHGNSYPDMHDLSIPQTADEYVDFIWRFVQTLKLQRPAFAGCAMSGSILFLLAVKYGDKISAIIPAEGNVDFRGCVGTEIAAGILNHPSVNTADFKGANTASLCGRGISREIINECIWHNARNAAPEVIDADLRIYNNFYITDRIQNITCPVLHLIGEDDCTVKEESKQLILKRIPNSRQVVLKNTGHFSCIENPFGFAKAIEEFLDTCCH